MLGRSQRRKSEASVRSAVLVAAVTLVALALPTAGPLYARVYPGPGTAFNAALTNASLDTAFTPRRVTQFEKARFRATVVYDTALDPELPTVKIAWSNVADLVAKNADDFVIEPVTPSRQFLDHGTRRPGGGYTLTWAWDVTPMVSGEQRLTLRILPTVVVGTRALRDVVDVNEPIPVKVDVHPAQREFDDVVDAAQQMGTDVPEQMTVGNEYDVSASMSLVGHADDIGADIVLAPADDSAEVSIREVASPQALAAPAALVSSAADVVRHWTVTPEEPGGVDLVFTATVTGHAADTDLEQAVPVAASARAVARGPSFWDRLQKPVAYLTPFVVFAATAYGLWAAWTKRRALAAAHGPADDDDQDDEKP
jgi:hypothetical protein